MRSFKGFVCAILVAAIMGTAAPANAQSPGSTDQPFLNVISANPFGILLEWFNAEYERVVTSSTTVGAGGSFFTQDGEDYRNLDVFWRFYLQDRILDGWMFGSKAGITNVPNQGTYFGIGFDLNRSWLMGPSDNIYIGAGFGLKRLLGVDEDYDDWKFIPTFRIVNVGIAF